MPGVSGTALTEALTKAANAHTKVVAAARAASAAVAADKAKAQGAAPQARTGTNATKGSK